MKGDGIFIYAQLFNVLFKTLHEPKVGFGSKELQPKFIAVDLVEEIFAISQVLDQIRKGTRVTLEIDLVSHFDGLPMSLFSQQRDPHGRLAQLFLKQLS